jgi:hypothetical protein
MCSTDLQIVQRGGSSQLVGFLNLGSERDSFAASNKPTLANHVLQFMFNGLTGFRFLVAHYPTIQANGPQLLSVSSNWVLSFYTGPTQTIYASSIAKDHQVWLPGGVPTSELYQELSNNTYNLPREEPLDFLLTAMDTRQIMFASQDADSRTTSHMNIQSSPKSKSISVCYTHNVLCNTSLYKSKSIVPW